MRLLFLLTAAFLLTACSVRESGISCTTLKPTANVETTTCDRKLERWWLA